MGGWKQWCGVHRGRENFDSTFCTMVRNPFWSPGYSPRAVTEVWEEEWKQPHCHIKQSRLFSPSQACLSSCTSPFSEWWPHLPTSIRNDPSFQTPLCVFKCCWSCLLTISYLFLLLHLNGHCFGSGPHFFPSYFKPIGQNSAWKNLVSTVLMPQLHWELSMGFWELSGSSLICPTFLCFAFIYRLHFPYPHPLYRHTHTLPSSTSLQFPPQSLCSYCFLSLLPHLPGKSWYTIQVFS